MSDTRNVRNSPVAEAPSVRRFQLSVRHDLPGNTHWGEHFDRYWRAQGVEVEKLDADGKLEYQVERAGYEHTAMALKRSPVKRARIAEHDKVAQKWAERQAKADRPLWASRVPSWYMAAHGLIVRTAAQVRQRPREQAPPHRRKSGDGGKSSRDGPSRSDDEAEPPGVALKRRSTSVDRSTGGAR